MKKLSLVIEKSKNGKLWGRVEPDNDLIVDFGVSPGQLEKKMKKLSHEGANKRFPALFA